MAFINIILSKKFVVSVNLKTVHLFGQTQIILVTAVYIKVVKSEHLL